MFDFEFSGTSYGDQIGRRDAINVADAKAQELLGDDWRARCAAINDARQNGELAAVASEIWQEIEVAATFAAFSGWREIPDNMTLVWR